MKKMPFTLDDEAVRRLLEAFDRLVPAIPDRPRDEVEKELKSLRTARRGRRRRAR